MLIKRKAKKKVKEANKLMLEVTLMGMIIQGNQWLAMINLANLIPSQVIPTPNNRALTVLVSMTPKMMLQSR